MDQSSISCDSSTSKTCLVTRIHRASSSALTDNTKLLDFVRQCQSYATLVLICVDIKETLEDTKYYEVLQSAFSRSQNTHFECEVQVIPISTWGKFTFALNAALLRAAEGKFNVIIFQSVEYSISATYARRVIQELINDISNLVVGVRLEGHEFYDDTVVELRGRTCPWNTMAAWNVTHLALTGFPMVGDAPGEEWGGVEEVSAIALLQLVRPHLKAILLSFQAVISSSTEPVQSSSASHWETNFENDLVRKAYHQRKMASKDERPRKQMESLGIPAGKVHHVTVVV